VVWTTTAISRHSRIISHLITGVKVDTPSHGAAETKVVSKLPLHLVSLFVIVAYPLIVPDKLLHHCLFVQSRDDTFFFDELVDLGERHDTCLASALAGLASSGERAAKLVATGIYANVDVSYACVNHEAYLPVKVYPRPYQARPKLILL
jgi:hypothetical protein